jgi:hypothetical protein
MAIPDPGGLIPAHDPKNFSDNVSSGGGKNIHNDTDRGKVQHFLSTLKNYRKQNMTPPDADPDKGTWGYYHAMRIEYSGPDDPTGFWRSIWLRISRSRRKAIRPFYGFKKTHDFSQPLPTANVDAGVQTVKRNMVIQLQADMATLSVPNEWRTIIRIAPSQQPPNVSQFDANSCGCCCGT